MTDKLLIKTLILIEDSRFYKHVGIDFISICRAFLYNLRERRYVQGGSTITQQLARTLYLNNKKKIHRKLAEIAIAFYLELRYSKKQILEKYMSEVYMGQDRNGMEIRGFEKASEFYFKKPLRKTDIVQKAYLVAMLKGPNIYKPNSRAGTVRMLNVLTKMLDSNIISLSEFYGSVR